ncbi:unnamed protein product [Prunus armeniaca]
MSDVTESSSSTLIVTVHTESSTNLPMGFKLNGSNYEIWASMIELHATTQGKLGYLTGKWKIADAVATRLKQEGRLISTCFAELKTIWLELDKRHPFHMKCVDDMKTFQAAVMADRVYDFLAGLDDTYDKRTGSGSSVVPPRRLTSAEKNKLKCDHCGQKRHTIDTYWSLHGVLDWEKDQRRLIKEQLDSKAHVAVAPTSVADHLTATPPPTLTAVSSTPTPSPPSNFGKAFHAHDTRDTGWIIDSGAIDHMTYNSALLSTTLPPHRDHVLIANNAAAPVTGASSILLTPVLPLDKVLPDIQTWEIFGRGTKKGGLYYVDDVATSWVLHAGSTETSQHRRIWLLHYRFGHASFGYLQHLFPALFSGVNESDFQCETCILAKSHRVSYPPSCNKRLMPFDLVHSDVWGPSPVSTALGVRWFVLFVDDCTRMMWLYGMKNKSDVVEIFQRFYQMIQTQFMLPIKGVLHETTCPQTPQQNGVAEHKNGQILAAAHALLLGASVPKRFWIDVVTYAVYLLNHLPSRVLDFQTPMQNQSSKLDPCALRCVFLGFSPHQKGYRCYHPATQRLYGETSSEGHNWLDLQGGVVLDSLIQREEPTEPAEPATPAESATLVEPAILTDVTTVTESIAPYEASLIVPDQAPLDILEVSASIHTSDNSYVLPPRRNRGVPPDCYSPKGKARYAIAHYVSDHRLSPECKAFVTRMDNFKIPTRVEEAFNDPNWAEAMNIEMEALQKNNTWDIVDLPKGTKPVGCRWVFTFKYNADGTVERYKARLVAKGFTQTYGVDYHDTFAPVAKMNNVRVLLSLVVNLDWNLRQFDVKNAFLRHFDVKNACLHGELEEEVYMSFLPGYRVTGETGNVYKLKKAMYGLKQSPRAWFDRFTAAMKKFGYRHANTDHTLFIKHRAGKVTLLIIYVDDMIVTGDDTVEIEEL